MRNKTASLNETENAYYRIKEMILSGQIDPGQIVSILYFSQQLQIGRTPVTGACQKLEAEGFLTILPKKGVLISPLTINDVRDLYEAREAIESYIGERAFDNITADDVEILKNCIEKQKECEKRHDAYGFMKEDNYFHLFILERYSNKTLLGLYKMMNDRIFIIGVQNSKKPNRIRAAIQEHNDMVAQIEKGDKAEFLRLLSDNILKGYYSFCAFTEK